MYKCKHIYIHIYIPATRWHRDSSRDDVRHTLSTAIRGRNTGNTHPSSACSAALQSNTYVKSDLYTAKETCIYQQRPTPESLFIHIYVSFDVIVV